MSFAAGDRVIYAKLEARRLVYGEQRYPGQLVLQDVRTLHGRQFRDAALIVGSSPCQEFSYRAMPWKRAKALGPPTLGIELFEAQFRIQREASEAAGRHIPLVVENVIGAQKWVGRARWHYGSYYLWGDVPALMPIVVRQIAKRPGHDWNRFKQTGEVSPHWRLNGEDSRKFNPDRTQPVKNAGGSWFRISHNNVPRSRGDAIPHTPRMTNPDEHRGVKQPGIGGVRANGRGDAWFQDGAARHGSKSDARKRASALIAKIPYPLARHIAACWKPA